MYGLLCFGWLAIIQRFIHCLFFHVFSFLKSSHWALPAAAQIQTVLIFPSPRFYMHLLQQEMIQRLSQGEVEQDCSMRLFHQVITAQTTPPLTRPPSHKAEQCVRNERNPLERNECLVNNKPRPCRAS